MSVSGNGGGGGSAGEGVCEWSRQAWWGAGLLCASGAAFQGVKTSWVGNMGSECAR